MPNRILKESICTSDNLDALSWFEEVLFYRLIVNCDDFGRMDARPAIIRSRLFPLKTITDAQIEKALQSLRSAAMIDLYVVDGRSYLQMRTWESHQQKRAKNSKYPGPESAENYTAIICNQMLANVPEKRESRIENRETNTRESARTGAHTHAREENAKRAYGEYENVFLTDEEYASLKEKASDADERIRVFGAKLKAKGYKYDDHYAALLLWLEEDTKKAEEGRGIIERTFVLDGILEHAAGRKYSEEKL